MIVGGAHGWVAYLRLPILDQMIYSVIVGLAYDRAFVLRLKVLA